MLTDEELLNKIRKIVREEILKSIKELSKLKDNIEYFEIVYNKKWEGTNGD